MSELIMSLTEIRFVFDGMLILAGGVVKFPLALQHRAQIAMRFGVVRTALQRLAKRRLGFRKMVAADHQDTVVIMTLWQIRIDRQSRAMRLPRLPGPAGPGIQGDQVRLSLRQFLVVPYRLLMLGDRLIYLSGIFEIDALHQ